MSRRRESMVKLADALGVEVIAGETANEILGKCIQHAENTTHAEGRSTSGGSTKPRKRSKRAQASQVEAEA